MEVIEKRNTALDGAKLRRYNKRKKICQIILKG